MIEKIKKHILELCKDKPKWKRHVELVVKNSKELAKKLGANEEVCGIAAWLHDIKKIKGESGNHHVHGAEEAVEILKKYDYDKIKEVEHCILTHSSDEKYMPESKEAKIVASADSLSHFDDFLFIVHSAFKLNETMEERKEWILKKYAKAWKKLMPEAQKIAKPKYDAIKLLI